MSGKTKQPLLIFEKAQECRLAEEFRAKARKKLETANIPYSEEEFLCRAAQGDTRTVNMFLDSGMHPDIRNSVDKTALMLAVRNGHIETVKVLLAGGAEVDARDHDGKTALMLAESKGHKEMEQLLRKARFSFFARKDGHI